MKPSIPVLVLVFLLIPGLAIPDPAQAWSKPNWRLGPELLTVGVDGTGEYETVGAALVAAYPGDTIQLKDGVYDEDLIIKKPVTIIGNGLGAPITGTWQVSVNGFTIEDAYFKDNTGSTWDSAGIITRQWDGRPPDDSYVSSLTIRRCTFENCRQGIFLFGAKNCLVEDCTFTGCWRGITIKDHYYAPKVWWTSHDNTIRDCTFRYQYHSGAREGEAIYIHDSDSNTVESCTMDGNSYGVVVRYGSDNTVKGCTISNSTYNPLVFKEVTKDFTVQGNTIREKGKDVVFYRCSQGRFDGNDMEGSSLNLDNSTNCNILGNTFEQGEEPAIKIGTKPHHYNHRILNSNTVGGNPVQYYYGESTLNIRDETAGAFYVSSCSGLVSNCEVKGGDGLIVYNSENLTFTDMKITNTLYGALAYNCTNLRIDNSTIDTGTRGLQGVHFTKGTLGTVADGSLLNPNKADSFKLTGDSKCIAHNLTFNGQYVNATNLEGGVLEVYNNLRVRVWDNGSVEPFEGCEVQVVQDIFPIYRTPHFKGDHAVTGVDGVVGPIVLLDREYNHSDTAREHYHSIKVLAEVDGTWTESRPNVDMSGLRLEEFEISDIIAPGAPTFFDAVDVPLEDAIDLSWEAPQAVDTLAFSIYWNVSGDWEEIDRVPASTTAFRVTEGIVHATEYYFKVSAWDEVDLESRRTPAIGVLHMDGVTPEAPENPRVLEVNASGCKLAWDRVPEDDIAGYHVYMNDTGMGPFGPWVRVTPEEGIEPNWFLVEGLVSETRYYFTVTAVDEVPNESPNSQALQVDIPDITPPDPPILDELPRITNDALLTVTGFAEAKSSVMVYINDELVDTTKASDSMRFVVQVTLTEGTNNISAKARDAMSNVGEFSQVQVVIRDTIAPEVPVLEELVEITNVPTIEVSGQAEANSTIALFVDGEEAGTAIAADDGNFSGEVTIEEGVNAMTARATDMAGNVGTFSLARTIILDTTGPEPPVLDELPAYTAETNITVSGTSEAMSMVVVLVGVVPIGEVEVGMDGAFALDLNLSEGENVLSARATDAIGNPGDVSTSKTVVLDIHPPVADAGESIFKVEETEVTFDGSNSTDDHGIASYVWTFILGGDEVTLEGKLARYTFPDPEILNVNLTVTDFAGHTARGSIEVDIYTKNLPPTLAEGTVDPKKGDTGTTFEFTVRFVDLDADDGTVWLILDGKRYLMSGDPDDANPTDGRTYTYYTKLSKGTHRFYFDATDAYGFDAEGPSAGETHVQENPIVESKDPGKIPGFATLGAIGAVLVMAEALVLHSRRRR